MFTSGETEYFPTSLSVTLNGSGTPRPLHSILDGIRRNLFRLMGKITKSIELSQIRRHFLPKLWHVMPVSAAQVATRAFATVLQHLARGYGVAVSVNRDSTHRQLETAFKKLSLKVIGVGFL